jgi:hypothetical protein
MLSDWMQELEGFLDNVDNLNYLERVTENAGY